MRNTLFFAGLATVIVAVSGAALVVGGDEKRPDPGRGAVILKTDSLAWKEVRPGATMATLWGDPDKGPSGTFTRFTPGFKIGLHHHSSDLRIIVIEGVYILGSPEREKLAGPGSYVFEPAGYKHTTAADPKQGCLIYTESQGKFDVVEDDRGPYGRP
jgi:quercetin dioxygenase-like cupin family protein